MCCVVDVLCLGCLMCVCVCVLWLVRWLRKVGKVGGWGRLREVKGV